MAAEPTNLARARSEGVAGEAVTPTAEERERERDRARNTRRRPLRARVEKFDRMSRANLVHLQLLGQPMPVHARPATRGDCESVPRPCPFVACRFHLYLDVQPGTGNLKLNFPDLEPGDLEVTCALDVADKGGAGLEEVGVSMNVTRERVRQIETIALIKLSRKADPR